MTTSNVNRPDSQTQPTTDQAPEATDRPKWEEIDQQLIEWGRQLDALWTKSRGKADPAQEKIIMELETSYNAVRQDILDLQERAERDRGEGTFDEAKAQLTELQDAVSRKAREATEQIKEGFENLNARVRSGEALEDIKETSEKLRIGAGEVGEGLTRAWSELRQSFDAASEKMKAKPDRQTQR